MARTTQPSASRLDRSSGISAEDLAACRRDRDFTNLLDLQHKHQHTFVRSLREHVEFFFSWRALRDSAATRVKFAESWLSLHGTEYWGLKNRDKYIMPDSVARGDEIRYPDDAADITKTLVLLIKRKAENISPKKERLESSQLATTPELGTRAREVSLNPSTTSRRTSKRLADLDVSREVKSKRSSMGIEFSRVEKRPVNKLDRERSASPSDTSSLSSVATTRASTPDGDSPPPLVVAPLNRGISTVRDISRVRDAQTTTGAQTTIAASVTAAAPIATAATLTVPGATTRPPPPSPLLPTTNETTPSKRLARKYRRDTFFLITTDRPSNHLDRPKVVFLVPARHGPVADLEKEWWNAEAQMEVKGAAIATEAEHINAAKNVITQASVKLEWSGDKILVRWENNDDWGFVMGMIQKAWMAREYGLLLDIFKLRIVLHIES
ncbi:hypothetical protein BJY04DRAFT_212751 [Aspergillus karnatakaensis]|uniref:uncharacterized protein n=1 Tax=Aspergillus karnatakaensis TaxID=1810916 RepID=UPI003CCD5A68